MTIPEVAERMRCEHRTVRRAIKAGDLQAALIGGKWLIREDAVDRWFEARCGTPAPRPQPARAPRRPVPDTSQTGSVARLRALEDESAA